LIKGLRPFKHRGQIYPKTEEGGSIMKAAIYCRVSTEDQEREGSSLDSQLEACVKKALDLG